VKSATNPMEKFSLYRKQVACENCSSKIDTNCSVRKNDKTPRSPV